MDRLAAIAATIVVLLAGATSALADPPARHNPNGRMLGVVTPKGQPQKGGGSKLLVNHGGPVMTTNTTYAIFWGPANAWPANYINTIDQYFTDVHADSGLSTNVYSVGTQYSSIQYQSTFGGPILDTNAYPASGCRDHGTTSCLTDSQLQTELLSDISGLPHDTSTAYFVFTPPNVGSCGSGVGCAFKNFCAYHSWINTTGGGTVLYANVPYALQTSACDNSPGPGLPGEHPNGVADPTLDGASHEHNEMITDPLGTAWFTNGGLEQADLCNFVYGSPVSGSPDTSTGLAYNQVINKHDYFIQEEWSNDGSACLQRYGG